MADQVLVFVSHTAAMKEYPEGTSFVDGVEEAVNAIDRAKAFHMAYFPAADMTPADYSVRQLSKADLFVAVIGFDLGSLVRGESRSYTEMEFDEATRLGMPRLVFLLRPEAAHLQGLSTRGVRREQMEFRSKLEESGATVAYFSSVDDLKYKVQAALNQWMDDQQERQSRTLEGQAATRRQSTPPSRPQVSRAVAPIGCLTMVILVAAGGLVIWTAIAATFPPWVPQAECTGASVTVIKATRSTFGPRGAVLEVNVENSTPATITIPAGRDVIAKGQSGRQYAAESPGGDQSWFFPVEVHPQSTARLRLGLDGSGPSDDVAITVPGVAGLGLPLTKCRMTSAPVPVDFGG